MGSRQVRNKVRHRQSVGSVVLCIGDGQNRLLAWARAGQVTSWGESCEAPGSSRQLPRRFSRPPKPGRRRRQTASSSQRLLPDPLLSYHHYNNNNIHAITTLSLLHLHPHNFSLCLSPLLFFLFPCIPIHSPTARSTTHHLNPGQPLPRLAFRGTILLVPHANSSRRARSPEPASSQPAAQHPRNTASSPSSSSPSSQSPHPNTALPLPTPPTILPPPSRQLRLTCDV